MIRDAEGPEDIAAVRRLFREYAASLPMELGYQDFEGELAGLPGAYAPPGGALLVAEREGAIIGCVALRRLPTSGCCEMKRLYVAPAGRGLGLGRALVRALIARARTLNYAEMRLDTIPSLTAALALYADEGFVEIPAYYDTPVAGTVFLAKAL